MFAKTARASDRATLPMGASTRPKDDKLDSICTSASAWNISTTMPLAEAQVAISMPYRTLQAILSYIAAR